MTEASTRESIESLLKDRRNWGRWGADDEVGAVNLITPEKRVAAAGLVRSGRTVSLSLPLPTTPAADNPRPAQHYTKVAERVGDTGVATDFYGVEYHGLVCTHIDALCHTWGADGMWQGRDPKQELTSSGTRFGGIQAWRDGIVTRGVLLDVPAYRGTPYVTADRPVQGNELAAIAASQGVTFEPGDALVVYSGRDRWDRENAPLGTATDRPGLHASCLQFIRDIDCSVLAWDMQDAKPYAWDLAWTVHAVIHTFGVAVVDNCALAPLAAACEAENRYEFMLVVAPLVVLGGTGSPANPLAIF